MVGEALKNTLYGDPAASVSARSACNRLMSSPEAGLGTDVTKTASGP